MDKTLEIYVSVLKTYLSYCFANQQNINPVELNRERFRTKAVFIAAIFFLKNGKRSNVSIILGTNDWFKQFFAADNLFSSIIDAANPYLHELIDHQLSNLISIEDIDVPTLYETLLSIETGNENTRTEISTAKNYRNKLGSYYTPSELAKAVTEKTINAFFELNYGIKKGVFSAHPQLGEVDVTAIKFADFSCGGGNFLVEIIHYFKQKLTSFNLEDREKSAILTAIALNISAFDVDCLALEVAKINMLLLIGQPRLYSDFKDNFVHANFLLQTNFVIDEATKRAVFSDGFIYHEQLALHKSKLVRYDIVLGNPPWEKIRFEEKKFYALYSTTIANNHFKSSRTNEINATEQNHVQLATFSEQFKIEIEKAKFDLKRNPFFSLSNNGELNTYALFTEAALKLKTPKGVVGLVLKSAIVTSQVNQKLFQYLTKKHLVVAIYDFINRKKLFNIDSRERFCFLLLGNNPNNHFEVSMNLTTVEELSKSTPLSNLSYEALKLLNPFTGMLPNVSTKEEIDFLLRISAHFPFFKTVFDKVRFGRIVHFTSHAFFL